MLFLTKKPGLEYFTVLSVSDKMINSNPKNKNDVINNQLTQNSYAAAFDTHISIILAINDSNS